METDEVDESDDSFERPDQGGGNSCNAPDNAQTRTGSHPISEHLHSDDAAGLAWRRLVLGEALATSIDAAPYFLMPLDGVAPHENAEGLMSTPQPSSTTRGNDRR